MSKEIILYVNNTKASSWLATIASVPWSIFSLLLILGGLNSPAPALGFGGWLLLLLFFLLTTISAAASIYSIPRSKYKVIWIEGERVMKKTGRNVYQEISSKSSPIKLHIRKINTGKVYIKFLEAIGDNGKMTIASSLYTGTLEKIIEKILTITTIYCARED